MTERGKILTKFAKQVKKLREEKGYSLRELASRSGLEYSQIQRIEQAKVNLAFSTLIAIADGLDITPSELLNY
jgi:transcriptional regulator with XRE-family HTH domain